MPALSLPGPVLGAATPIGPAPYHKTAAARREFSPHFLDWRGDRYVTGAAPVSRPSEPFLGDATPDRSRSIPRNRRGATRNPSRFSRFPGRPPSTSRRAARLARRRLRPGPSGHPRPDRTAPGAAAGLGDLRRDAAMPSSKATPIMRGTRRSSRRRANRPLPAPSDRTSGPRGPHASGVLPDDYRPGAIPPHKHPRPACGRRCRCRRPPAGLPDRRPDLIKETSPVIETGTPLANDDLEARRRRLARLLGGLLARAWRRGRGPAKRTEGPADLPEKIREDSPEFGVAGAPRRVSVKLAGQDRPGRSRQGGRP